MYYISNLNYTQLIPYIINAHTTVRLKSVLKLERKIVDAACREGKIKYLNVIFKEKSRLT